MSESIVLTTPVTHPSTTDYQPGSLLLQLLPTPLIHVMLVASTGEETRFTYPAPNTPFNTPATVTTLIGNLNTTNLSTRSLWRRVFDRLVADFPERFNGGATVA